jgi:hypothetical protein
VLDLITTQNQAGIALGFVGVSRLIEQLDAVGKTAAISATEFVTDVSLSVIAVDSDVRTAAYKSGGMWLPENVTDRDQVTYIGPSVRGTDKNVSVPLLLHEDGRIRTTALERVDYVQVGEVIFQRRMQEATMPRPATEIYERSDWWIRATNQTFSLRVRTGSRLVDETVHTAHAESNVRHLSYLRDTE